ncbi:MAG: hypothetical protein C4288_20875 [Leptolyngbya sp. ERB_1_1]
MLIGGGGLGVGLLTGLLGVGGGFATVPALVLLVNTPIKEAVGTSLVIIGLNSVTGFLGYLNHVTLDWHLMASFTLASALGTLVGVYLTRFVAAQLLQKSFSYFLVTMAIFILIQNRTTFHTSHQGAIGRNSITAK